MKLILRYLRPFAFILAVSLAFLLIQVFCDLGQPRLMSEMVDIGIQSGGIESGAPEAISAEGIELLNIFLDEQDGAILADGYSLVLAGTNKEISARYPTEDKQDILIRDDPHSEDVDRAYTRAVHALVLSLEKSESNDGNLKLEQLYSMLPFLAERKASGELTSFISSAATDNSLVSSRIGVTFTRLFYNELGVDLKQFQRAYMIEIGMKMLGVSLLGGLAAIMVGWFGSRIGTSVAMQLRRDIFEKVTRFPKVEYEQFSPASLITRTTNDVQQIQQLILTGLRLLLFAPIMGIGGIILAIRSSLSMSWIIAVSVISIFGIVFVLFSLSMPKFKTLQKLIDKLNLITRENLSGMLVIRAFGNEKYEETRFEQANSNLKVTNRFVQRTMAFMFPAMTLVMNLIILLIIWVGAGAVATSELQIGNMMAFMQYATQIIMSFLLMSLMFMMIPRALASAERIQEVLDTEVSISDPKHAKSINVEEGGRVEFKNVSFQYKNAEEPVLEDISFTAWPGQMTAFIGTTGSGKSTLVNLIPRFYDVTDGVITINGIDIREHSQEELHINIGYVPQKGFLFSGDIVSNVRYGMESADESEIEEALEVAQAKGFVQNMPDGIKTTISQGGVNVSGGQRQRLAIARALIKKAPIYIFDDSFSALDLKTDAALRRALRPFTYTATVLVVAQRVSTIKHAEQIIMLDKGRIVGKGTHPELLKSCASYREIAESQLEKEALA
ncbi:ABC transporter ATP-binding protein [Paenibacillus sp. FSL R7-0048]|uniref:ABC transporter ATP-binding protein n=1 Tax=Paenibacillus TaxID=44249 RepID=UPI00096DB856|nr:ABC transporter ATP-binding protein [Paenibacillus odorifer]OMD70156.1 ABC transporter [Paenibacillus odorifer]